MLYFHFFPFILFRFRLTSREGNYGGRLRGMRAQAMEYVCRDGASSLINYLKL